MCNGWVESSERPGSRWTKNDAAEGTKIYSTSVSKRTNMGHAIHYPLEQSSPSIGKRIRVAEPTGVAEGGRPTYWFYGKRFAYAP
jgi:hypothetical protein